jgi:hypothetical protein
MIMENEFHDSGDFQVSNWQFFDNMQKNENRRHLEIYFPIIILERQLEDVFEMHLPTR